MTATELLVREWTDIPREKRPDAIRVARERAGRLALSWGGDPDERTYAEKVLRGQDRARWEGKTSDALRRDPRVCHFVDALLRAQAAHRRRRGMSLPKTAAKLVEQVRRTRASRETCRGMLIDLHCGTPLFNDIGDTERQALSGMFEKIKRDNERAEMLLIAAAIYPASALENGRSPHVEPEGTGGLLTGDAWDRLRFEAEAVATHE